MFKLYVYQFYSQYIKKYIKIIKKMIEDGTLFYTLPIHESLRQKEIILGNPKCNLKILL